MDAERPMPEVVRDLGCIRSEHARLAAGLGSLGDDDRRALAVHDDELTRFDGMCTGQRPMRLFSFGLLPGDEIRHPAAPGLAARLVPGNAIEIDGIAMDVLAATRRVAASAALRSGIAVGDWAARGVRLGDGLGLNPIAVDAPTTVRAVPPPPAGSNLSFAF